MTEQSGNRSHRPYCSDCGVVPSPKVKPERDELVLHCGECDSEVATADIRFADVDLLTGGQHVQR